MKIPNLTSEKKVLFTKNLVPGKKVYGERLRRFKGVEFREFKPMDSKLAAAIVKGITPDFEENSIILYLGASTGTTASHISDIAAKGFVFALDSAHRVVRDLYFVCEQRKNMAPMLEDAALPVEYEKHVPEVDFIYQDISQKNQVQIFLNNLKFLKKKKQGLLMVKARSIDFKKNPEEVFEEVRAELEKSVKILAEKTLAPYQKYHCAFLIEKR